MRIVIKVAELARVVAGDELVARDADDAARFLIEEIMSKLGC